MKLKHMKKSHILITGERGIGKSTLVNRLLQNCSIPLYGYRTKNVLDENGKSCGVYIYSILDSIQMNTEENCVASPVVCAEKGMISRTQVFDVLGVEYLREARPDGLLVMDELGFLETEAMNFRRAVLRRLDGDIPVLAVVRMNKETDFLNQVRRHPKTELFTVTEENRDMLYEELKDKIKAFGR